VNDYEQMERLCFWLAVLFIGAFGWIIWKMVNLQ